MAVKVKAKRVVICADDFGMNPGIDEGILQLAQLRRLNATSCLVQGPSFAGSAAALKMSGLQVGLHLNFTEPLGQPGLYLPVSSLIMRSYLSQLDMALVRAQIVRQLDLFEAVLDQPPDFIDGHQHVHQLPQIRRALLSELAHRHWQKRPWLRSTRMGSQKGLPWRQQLKARIIQQLGSRGFAQLAIRKGFATNSGFSGVYDFQGGEAAYRALLDVWLAQAGQDSLLMCHPARKSDAADGLGAQRVAEFRVLAGNQMGQWIEQYGLDLG